MKQISKLMAVLLCVAALLCGVSCSSNVESDIPSGMKLATAAYADYRLYVPSSWNENTSYGVSGAYFTMTQHSTVSVMKYEITQEMREDLQTEQVAEGGARLDWFWESECKAAVGSVAQDGKVDRVEEESNALLLGGENAHRYHVTATVYGELMHFLYVVAEKNDAFYVFSFTVVDELYTSLLPNVESMLENFIFSDEAYLPETHGKRLDENAEAPEGMKLASNDDVAYRFYVPTDWKIDRNNRIFSAYLESDRSNVSVVPYMPDEEGVSAEQFFEMCEEMMLGTAGSDGYTRLNKEVVQMGGKDAMAYTYRYRVGGAEYQYLQVIAIRGSMLYSLTYTARPEHFESHLNDVQRMIDAFAFR